MQQYIPSLTSVSAFSRLDANTFKHAVTQENLTVTAMSLFFTSHLLKTALPLS